MREFFSLFKAISEPVFKITFVYDKWYNIDLLLKLKCGWMKLFFGYKCHCICHYQKGFYHCFTPECCEYNHTLYKFFKKVI